MKCFIHEDGHVFTLEDEDGRHTLPEKEDIPFSIEKIMDVNFDEGPVLFGKPGTDEFPGWPTYHDLIVEEKTTKILRKSILATWPLVVGRAIVVDGRGKTVVCTGGRGYNKGRCTTPGGVISFGETVEEAVIREVKEEAGIEVEIIRLLGTDCETSPDGWQRVSVIYLCRPKPNQNIKPNMDDVVEVQWEDVDKAVEEYNYYAFRFLKDIMENSPELLEFD